MKNIIIKNNAHNEPTLGSLSKVYMNNSSFEVVTPKNQIKHPTNLNKYKKLNEKNYVNLYTGEIKEYKSTPYKSKTNLKKTLNKVKRLVNANVSNEEFCLHLILTYANCVSDPFRLTRDFKSFWNELKKHYPNYSYIWIAEPHATKSWHIHTIIKSNDRSIPFVKKEILSTAWKFGKFQIKYCPRENNFGCYFCKKDKIDRYEVYPSKMRIYSHSKSNIVVPKPVTMTRGQILKLAEDNNMKRTNISTINVFNETNYGRVLVNQITYENFERKEV